MYSFIHCVLCQAYDLRALHTTSNTEYSCTMLHHHPRDDGQVGLMSEIILTTSTPSHLNLKISFQLNKKCGGENLRFRVRIKLNIRALSTCTNLQMNVSTTSHQSID